jgi:4-amino-4-deoxy-L-arabinose transferase-like glycosyltransferase
MDPQRDGRIWFVALAFLVLGAATRFYQIGWSVSGDHTSTFAETKSLTEKPFFLPVLEPYDVQARTLPVSYGLQALAFKVFGTDEAQSRYGSALAGTLSIGVTVLIVSRLYGLTSGIITGIALVLWPWLLGHSQSNRHYSYAFLFASLAILSATAAWKRDSIVWGILGGLFSALAVLSHSIAAVVPAGLLLFLAVEVVAKRSPVQRRALWSYIAVGGPLMIMSCALGIWAFGGFIGFAAEAGWGRSPHLLGLAYNLTWGVTLVSLLGGLLSWRSEDACERMWTSIAVMSVAACVIVPLITAFRPDYVFPAALVFFLLAARVLAKAYESLKEQSRLLAAGLAGVVLALPLPSVASYYQDGDVCDYRSAAGFIKDERRGGDIIAADTPGALGYYLDGPVVSAGRLVSQPQKSIAILRGLVESGSRLWYVCRFSRDEIPTAADRWLWKNGIRMIRIKKKRFDYTEHALDVYLLNPTVQDKERIEKEAP